jgi:hypothetical protein
MLITLHIDIIVTQKLIPSFLIYEEGKGESASLTSPKLAT